MGSLVHDDGTMPFAHEVTTTVADFQRPMLVVVFVGAVALRAALVGLILGGRAWRFVWNMQSGARDKHKRQ